MTPFNLLDLFSGIGGFSLGLERSGGFKTVACCEIDPFCRKVLRKHWPDVPIDHDITQREFRAGEADFICGGFPCQDISLAGEGAGLTGERSGLYREIIRAIRVVRPIGALLENVAALLGRGMGNVLGDLAEIGYDAEWHCIPAAAVGAPHRRDRVWIVANPRSEQHEGHRAPLSGPLAAQLSKSSADASSAGLQVAWPFPHGEDGQQSGGMPAADSWWSTEPAVGRVAHGVPARVDRLRSLGNAVVPQLPELIGRAIMQAEATDRWVTAQEPAATHSAIVNQTNGTP
jgi:DNA (cytosine-5)-methyltransferase 1